MTNCQVACLLLLLGIALASAVPVGRQQRASKEVNRSRIPLLKKALQDARARQALPTKRRELVESGSFTPEHNTIDDPLANFLKDVTAAERQLIHDYESRMELLKEAIEVPGSEQLPSHPEPEQLPSHPEPEQLPSHPEPEQLPSHPEPEQLPSHPEPEQLPSHPEPEQLPSHPEPEQLPTHPEPEQLPSLPEPEQLPSLPEPEQLPADPVPEQLPSNPEPEQLPSHPEPEQLPSHPEPEQLPAHPEPEQLPADPVPEQLPVNPVPEQLPVHPVPEQLPADPVPEQLPVYPVPEQIPADPMPEQLPALPEDGRVELPALPEHNNPEPAPYKATRQRRSAKKLSDRQVFDGFLNSLSKKDSRLLQENPSRIPLLKKALLEARARQALSTKRRELVESGSFTPEHNTIDDPLANFLKDVAAAERQLIRDYESKMELLKEAIEVPEPEQLPSHPKPEQLPSLPEPEQLPSHPKPEQLPSLPEPEQLPSLPEPEQLPSHPEPEQLPSHPESEQLPSHPEPEQLPSHPEPEQLPADPVPEQLPSNPEPEQLPAHPEPEQLPAHPEPEQLPAHPEPEQLPAHPEPEQLPAHPEPEQLPVHPVPEQLPVHPVPEQLPADPVPEQLPVNPMPEQIPADPVPEQLPALPEDGRVELPALPEHNNPEPAPYKVSTSKRSIRSDRLTEFLDELTEENMALANNIRLKLRILQQALESPGNPDLLDTTQSAKRSSDPEFERFMRGLSGPDADLLKKFQSRLHLVREALHMPKSQVKKSSGFGDFVPLNQMPTHKSKEEWGDAPLPDRALGLVEESRCLGGQCNNDLQKPVSIQTRRIAAELLAAKETNPRLRSLLERLMEERRHDTSDEGLVEQQLEDLAKRKRSIH